MDAAELGAEERAAYTGQKHSPETRNRRVRRDDVGQCVPAYTGQAYTGMPPVTPMPFDHPPPIWPTEHGLQGYLAHKKLPPP